jgi:predicted secreted protein
MKNLTLMSIVFWACSGLVLAHVQCAKAQGSGGPSFDNPEQLIEVPVGQEFRIALDSNPTTGFQWQLSETLDEAIVTFVGDDYKTPRIPGRTGTGGKHTWTFRAVGQGQTVIALRYSRPWEKGVDPLKKVTFTVIVR